MVALFGWWFSVGWSTVDGSLLCLLACLLTDVLGFLQLLRQAVSIFQNHEFMMMMTMMMMVLVMVLVMAIK